VFCYRVFVFICPNWIYCNSLVIPHIYEGGSCIPHTNPNNWAPVHLRRIVFIHYILFLSGLILWTKFCFITLLQKARRKATTLWFLGRSPSCLLWCIKAVCSKTKLCKLGHSLWYSCSMSMPKPIKNTSLVHVWEH
jgi:hypothetical protein